jgi:hypothetical protein
MDETAGLAARDPEIRFLIVTIAPYFRNTCSPTFTPNRARLGGPVMSLEARCSPPPFQRHPNQLRA